METITAVSLLIGIGAALGSMLGYFIQKHKQQNAERNEILKILDDLSADNKTRKDVQRKSLRVLLLVANKVGIQNSITQDLTDELIENAV